MRSRGAILVVVGGREWWGWWGWSAGQWCRVMASGVESESEDGKKGERGRGTPIYRGE